LPAAAMNRWPVCVCVCVCVCMDVSVCVRWWVESRVRLLLPAAATKRWPVHVVCIQYRNCTVKYAGVQARGVSTHLLPSAEFTTLASEKIGGWGGGVQWYI
jgi:hypothetical protein